MAKEKQAILYTGFSIQKRKHLKFRDGLINQGGSQTEGECIDVEAFEVQ